MFIVIKRHIICKYKLFGCLSSHYSILCQCHITELKISEKPFEVNKMFEEKKSNEACRFWKEFILTETTKSIEEK